MNNNPSSDPIGDIIKRQIGHSTYYFLKGNGQFSRTIDLLYISQMLINNLKGKLIISMPFKREYSYIVTPAAKALEGVLLAIALHKGMILQQDIDKGVSIGKIYDGLQGKPALAKKFVLKPKDIRVVDTIYGDWTIVRNKVLHYDEDFFIDSIVEAEETVKDIYKTIGLAYQIFIGQPNKVLSLGFILSQSARIKPRL